MPTRLFGLFWFYFKAGMFGVAVSGLCVLAYGGIRFESGRLSVITFGAVVAATGVWVTQMFESETVAENMRKYGGFVPGLRSHRTLPLRWLLFKAREHVHCWWERPSVEHKTAH